MTVNGRSVLDQDGLVEKVRIDVKKFRRSKSSISSVAIKKLIGIFRKLIQVDQADWLLYRQWGVYVSCLKEFVELQPALPNHLLTRVNHVCRSLFSQDIQSFLVDTDLQTKNGVLINHSKKKIIIYGSWWSAKSFRLVLRCSNHQATMPHTELCANSHLSPSCQFFFFSRWFILIVREFFVRLRLRLRYIYLTRIAER